ncbi:MAG TPA: hypothetical protein VFB45_12955 [Pseudolabrys sp.]|nr:hypothetical protein [Pseudolabrys sp.]
MKKLIFAATAAIALTAAIPASAQIYAGADPGGVGVRVGPLGVGVGPDYGWGYRGDCRLVRERIVTPSGRVIFRTHRDCY